MKGEEDIHFEALVRDLEQPIMPLPRTYVGDRIVAEDLWHGNPQCE